VVTASIEIERVLGELGETPYEPMKEEHDETMSGKSIIDCQLHVLNETFINFFGKGIDGKLDRIQLFLLTFTIVVNYVDQENIPLQHAFNLQTQGQNVPSAEVGIRLTIVV
jgi:hypothetical protein